MNAKLSDTPARQIRRTMLTPAVLIVVGILATAAVGLNASVRFMQLTFRKERVELRQPVASLPSRMGKWVQLSIDRPLPGDIEHTLGTHQYVFRKYADSSVIPDAEITRIKALEGDARELAIVKLRQQHPRAVIDAALTYYTGGVDTVAHIPERCFVGGGFDTNGGENRQLPVKNMTGDSLTVRLLRFYDSTSAMSSRPLVVGYFFQVNGGYEYDAVGGVRKRLQNLTEKHAYYAKIELMMELGDQGDAKAVDVAADVFADFLGSSIGDFEKILPDWKAVEMGK